MPYTPFDQTKPDPATQNITQFGTSIRTNEAAIRDMVVGMAPFGWNLSITGGTPEQPGTSTLSKGTERVRCVTTWGTSGGAANNPTIMVYSYSANSGSTWDAIGTVTMAYDSNGNLTSSTWS